MLLYSDVKTEVASRVIDVDDLLDDSWFQRQKWAAQAFLVLHSGGYWLKDEAEFTTTSGTSAYAFQSNAWIVTQVIDEINRHVLDIIDYEKEGISDPDRSGGGQPSAVYRIASCGVSAQPASASVITAVSSSASDITSYTIRFRGLVGGLEHTEQVTLTGTTPVSTSASFTHLYEANKNQSTNGTITITAGTDTLLILPSEPLYAIFPWWRFTPVIAGAYDTRYVFIRKPTNVVQSDDRFEVPEEMEDCLVEIFEFIALHHFQEFKKSVALREMAKAHIQERAKTFNAKTGSFAVNQGNYVRQASFMNGLVGFKDYL